MSVEAAEALWQREPDASRSFDQPISAAVELLLTTGGQQYRQLLLGARDQIVERIGSVGWAVGRALPLIDDPCITSAVREAVARSFARTRSFRWRAADPPVWERKTRNLAAC